MKKVKILSAIVLFSNISAAFAGGNEKITSLSAGTAQNKDFGSGGAIQFKYKNPDYNKVDLRLNASGLRDKNNISRGSLDARFMYGFPVGDRSYLGGNIQVASNPLMQSGGLGLSYSREGDVNTINVDLNYLGVQNRILSSSSRPTTGAPNITVEMEQRLNGSKNKDALVLTESVMIGGLTLDQSTFYPGNLNGTFYDETQNKKLSGGYHKISLGLQKALGQRVALRFEVINEGINAKYDQVNQYSISGYPIAQASSTESGKKNTTTGMLTAVIKLNK